MLRDSDPERACAIKCYSTDSKEVPLMRIIRMENVMVGVFMMRRVVNYDDKYFLQH